MSWSAKYVGLVGLTCWGLVAEVYGQELEIKLPRYEGTSLSTEEHADIAALINAQRVSGPWREVGQAKPLDVLLFRRGPYPAHVGLYVAPGQMLHVDRDGQARMARFDGPLWSRRLLARYRHLKRF